VGVRLKFAHVRAVGLIGLILFGASAYVLGGFAKAGLLEPAQAHSLGFPLVVGGAVIIAVATVMELIRRRLSR